MKKVVDITERLSFEESPKLKIKNTEISVNDDAPTMLKILQLLGDGSDVNASDVVTMYETLFSEKDRKKLDDLKLKFKDFETLVMTAVDLVVGSNEDVGE